VTDPGAICRIRVAIPVQLRALAGVEPEVTVVVDDEGSDPPSTRRLLDALEKMHPDLRGTIRHQDTGARRAYMRYFAGTEDLSHDTPDAPLPEAVVSGDEPFRIVGAIAGG
jgi:molybdopterin synthase sulfur carrier subunit